MHADRRRPSGGVTGVPPIHQWGAAAWVAHEFQRGALLPSLACSEPYDMETDNISGTGRQAYGTSSILQAPQRALADATVENPDYAVTPEPDAAAQLNVNLTPTLS